jgi:type II secretory pathway predicted ATPase ExeA
VEHLHHFQLSGDPFRNEPLLRSYFESQPHQGALQRLERAVRQGKGLCVLTGETGSGKTMVVRRLLECLEEEVFEASMMVVLDGAADASWMLKRFARQLGLEDPTPEREGMIAQIYDQLAIVREEGRQPVLIIDDAHALARHGALAEVCSLLKLEYEDRRLLSLVLAGPAILDQSLGADPSLAHRIDVRVELASFSPEAATGYLAHRVSQVGGDPGIIDGGALAALHELGSGYPGLMNTLADNALFEAFICGRNQMTRVDVERAHRDLGWAPVASSASAPSSPELPTAPPGVSAPNSPQSPTVAADPVLQQTLDELDPDLAAMFKAEPAAGGSPPSITGPPKVEEAEPEDLLVELVED